VTPSWLTELRRLAQAASGGEWSADFDAQYMSGDAYRVETADRVIARDFAEADALYLAALSPARVLALVEVAEKVRVYETAYRDWWAAMAGADGDEVSRRLGARNRARHDLFAALAEMDGREGRDAT
jgi:hypothetical protein